MLAFFIIIIIIIIEESYFLYEVCNFLSISLSFKH